MDTVEAENRQKVLELNGKKTYVLVVSRSNECLYGGINSSKEMDSNSRGSSVSSD